MRTQLLAVTALLTACPPLERPPPRPPPTPAVDDVGGKDIRPTFTPIASGALRAVPVLNDHRYDVVPKTLHLEVGEVREVRALKFGETPDNPRWRSVTPNIVSVIMTDRIAGVRPTIAVVRALAPGVGEVQVSDDAVEPTPMTIVVVEEGTRPLAPLSAEFVPDRVELRYGSINTGVNIYDTRGTLVASLLSLTGERVGDTDKIAFISDDGAGVDSAFRISADLVGLAHVRVTFDGAPVIGAQEVLSPAPGDAPACELVNIGSGSAVLAPVIGKAIQCEMTSFPVRIPRPGMSLDPRVTVARHRTSESGELCNDPDEAFAMLLRREVPDEIAWERDGVIDVDDTGHLRSVAPGTTRVWAAQRGRGCGETVVTVLPDLNGTWSYTCAEESGLLRIADWTRHASLQGDFEDAYRDDAVIQRASASVCGGCSDRAQVSIHALSADGACSSTTPCLAGRIALCAMNAAEAEAQLEVRGRDTLVQGTCTFQRAANGGCAP